MKNTLTSMLSAAPFARSSTSFKMSSVMHRLGASLTCSIASVLIAAGPRISTETAFRVLPPFHHRLTQDTLSGALHLAFRHGWCFPCGSWRRHLDWSALHNNSSSRSLPFIVARISPVNHCVFFVLSINVRPPWTCTLLSQLWWRCLLGAKCVSCCSRPASHRESMAAHFPPHFKVAPSCLASINR